MNEIWKTRRDIFFKISRWLILWNFYARPSLLFALDVQKWVFKQIYCGKIIIKYDRRTTTPKNRSELKIADGSTK